MSNGKSGKDNPLDRDPLHGEQKRKETPQNELDASGTHSDIPAVHTDLKLPHTDVNAAGAHTDLPGAHTDATIAPHGDTSTGGGTQAS